MRFQRRAFCCRCKDVPYDEDLKGIGERWMRDPETGKGGTVPSDMTYQEWKGIYVDKTGGSGIINTYPGNNSAHRSTNTIPQNVKNSVIEAESTIVQDFQVLKRWHEPIAYGSVEGGLALHNFDYKTGRCTISLLDSAFSDPKGLMAKLQKDYDNYRSY